MATKKQLTTISPNTLFRVIVLLIGVIYGTLHHFRVIPEDLNVALMVTLLLFLVEQFFEIGHKLDDAVRESDGTAERVRLYLAKDRGIFGELLKTTHEDLSNTIKFQDGGFAVVNPALAIFSYSRFWEFLTEDQRRRGESKAINVVAIHSCAMDIWATHSLTARLLDRQKEFHRLGGKVTRILCARGRRPDENAQKAYQSMVDAGIEVRYYDILTETVNHSFGWDFLYISEAERAVIWDSFATAPGQVIGEALYINSSIFRGTDLNELWRDILSHSEPFPKTG
jgi:hypothetical protein